MKKSVIPELFGSWKLISLTHVNSKNEEIDLYGKDPIGILTYDSAGYMNAQFGCRDRPNFQNESLSGGKDEEIISAYKSYMAYYGKFEEAEPGKIVHYVEGALFPNWQGHQEIRFAEITGDKLIITIPPTLIEGEEITLKAVWKRG
jgi:hypothetical protein